MYKFFQTLLSPFFLVAALCIVTGCSSSNSGGVLPEQQLDLRSPKIRNFTPPDVQANLVETNTSFRAAYDELLDPDSVLGNVKLASSKIRNIYETPVIGSKDFIYQDRDYRPIMINQIRERFTETRERIIRESVDEDGVREVETVKEVNEVDGTTLTITPEDRLALSSFYSLQFKEGLKDLSLVSSVSPVDGSVTTGNFAGSVSYEFGTVDGQWREGRVANEAFLSANVNVSKVDYISTDNRGYVVWLQQDLSLGNSYVYWREFSQSDQTFNGAASRADYVGVLDTDSQQSDEAIDFVVNGIKETHCLAWIYKEPTNTQSVYFRCGNDGSLFERVRLTSHSDASNISSLSIQLVDEFSGYVSYVFDGKHYVYAFSLIDQTGPNVVGSDILGGGDISVLDVSVKPLMHNQISSLSVLYSFVDVSQPISSRYGLSQTTYSLSEGGLFSKVISVADGSEAFDSISSGFDFIGRGGVSWVGGASTDSRLFLSRFDLNTWSSPIVIQKRNGAVVTDSGFFQFYDGQSLFSWIEKLGDSYQLKAQGLFSVSSGNAFVLPPVITLSESSSELRSLNVIGDREGNGFVFYDNGERDYAVRFRQNIAWESAWDSPEDLGQSAAITSAVKPILRDGRMAYVTKRSENIGFDAVTIRLFSDFD